MPWCSAGDTPIPLSCKPTAGEKTMQGIFVHPGFPLAAPSHLLEDGEEENLCLLLQEPNQMIPQPLLALKSPALFSTASS